MIAPVVLIYVLSIPLLSGKLRSYSEALPPLSLQQAEDFHADAIVILGGGVRYRAPDFGGKSVCSDSSLKRALYGAYLAKKLGLNVIVTGGYGETSEESEAECMRLFLAQLGVTDVLVESRSRNTWENAKYSKEVADKNGISKIILVTSADHALRAQESFEEQGFKLLSAPTDFQGATQPWETGLLCLVPNHGSFDESCRALRAELGLVWYRLAY